MPLYFIRDDITKVKADAIVLPANRKLAQGSGASRSIYLAVGEKQLEGELKLLRQDGSKDGKVIEFGKAVATQAYHLEPYVKWIIHAVGPQWIDGKTGEYDYLYSAYKESLLLAKEKKCRSIAFPVLSVGNYKFPKVQALRIANNAILDFLEENEMDVYLVFFGSGMMAIASRLFGVIESRIDDEYVKSIDNIYHNREYRRMTETSTDWYGQKEAFQAKQKAPVPTKALSNLLDDAETEESFHDMFLRLTAQSGMTDPEIYKAARMQKQLYSKIKTKPDYKPGKKNILALAFALKLTTVEAEELLMKAGYCLSDTDDFDIVMKYCLDRRKYDYDTINDFLHFAGLGESTFEEPKK